MRRPYARAAPPATGAASAAQASRQRRQVQRPEAGGADPAQIAVEEVAQVRQAVFEHGDAVESHAPGEALIFVGVDAAVAQHIGVDHAAAENLQPVLALAEAD